MKKMENYYFIGMVAFFCTTIFYVSKSRNLNKDLIISLTKQEECLIKQAEIQKKLRNYTLVSIILNDITDKTRLTKKLKANDPQLQSLLEELN